MKADIRFILLFLFFLLSSHSYSKDLNFKWKLEKHGQLLINGITSTYNEISHSDALTGYDDRSSELPFRSRMCLATGCSPNDFVIYETTSSTNIVFEQNNPDLNAPEPFKSLLGNGSHSLQHKTLTRYILKDQMSLRDTVGLISCIFCLPFCCIYDLFTGKCNSEAEARLTALEAAQPNRLPEHVIINKRSLFHRALGSDNQEFLSSSTEVIDDNTHIFDLFLNAPETQKWIIENLYQGNAMNLELIIPELFNITLPALIHVQTKITAIDNEIMHPSHFLSINIANGTRVIYHLKQLSDNEIQVLAIVVSAHGLTLTFNVDNYDVTANEPIPYNTALPKTCDCNGACNCADSRKNNNGDSDGQSDTIITRSTLSFFPHSHAHSH